MRPLLLLAALAAATVSGQPLRPGQVVLRVEAEQVVRDQTQWRTAWGSFSRDLLNTRILAVSLRQLGAGDGQVTVRWAFVGRDHARGKNFIYDAGEAAGRIVPGGVIVVPRSRQLVQNRSQTLLLGRERTGQHPWGWTVRVYQGERLLAETASLPELLAWEAAQRDHVTARERKKFAGPQPLAFVPQSAAARR